MNIEEELQKLSYEELVRVNRIVVDRIKFIRDERYRVQLQEFAPGDVVEFSDQNGKLVRGTIERVNKKTVSIDTKDGLRWKVPPSFLKKVFQKREIICEGVFEMEDEDE